MGFGRGSLRFYMSIAITAEISPCFVFRLFLILANLDVEVKRPIIKFISGCLLSPLADFFPNHDFC